MRSKESLVGERGRGCGVVYVNGVGAMVAVSGVSAVRIVAWCM